MISEVTRYFVEWIIEPALECDETLAIPTCITSLAVRPLVCNESGTEESHLVEVCALEQRLEPRLLAQEAQLQHLVRHFCSMFDLT